MDTRSPLITRDDIHLFNEGRHFRLYDKLGAVRVEGGVHFAVWAPNAKSVSVIGNFNGWDKTAHFLHPQESSGIWAGVIGGIDDGEVYKYHIVSHQNDYAVEKADPFAVCTECPPKTASVVRTLAYEWNDSEWMESRAARQSADKAISVYEVHLGSWKRHHDSWHSYSYRDLAKELVPYVKEMGFTHVELLPVAEHPFFGSWGYQVTGYFAPTARYGEPEGFMELVDAFHQAGIGVIMDWVPSHFPSDLHGLSFFDGTNLFEHQDMRQGYHPDWNSFIFNYGRNEVRAFLISNALFWLDKYHIDALRVDGVASMLYLDYSRQDGEWIPNIYGGNENLEAIHFLKDLNETVYSHFPSAQMIAEESTAWPMVSRPTYLGGLGFGMKWDMGWMHDTLKYFSKEPVHRKYHQNDLTFRGIYAFQENFVLSLSHDEVVYGKNSLLNKMPGDEWQQYANLRSLYAYMTATPGKKLLFMGGEFGQRAEWAHDSELEWHLLQYAPHQNIQRMIKDLNALYAGESALHEQDFSHEGFEWIDCSDWEASCLTFIRYNAKKDEAVVCTFNFTPVVREGYRIGVPYAGKWQEIFNSDSALYGGGDNLNKTEMKAVPAIHHGRPYFVSVTLPPLGGVFLKWTQT